MHSKLRTLGAIVVFSAACAASAQTTLNIWPGTAPGSENWTQKEQVKQLSWGKVVVNVVTPTITAYLPEKSKAIRHGRDRGARRVVHCFGYGL